MNTISTGYIPDGALGAMFMGMNAANAQDQNDQDLARMFLANQREQQMQPLDVQLKQLQVAPAQFQEKLAQSKMNSPDYIPAELRGYIGQMNTQDASGQKAQALLPFQIKAEKGSLENQANDNSLLQQFQQIDNLIQQGGDIDANGVLQKFTPQQQQMAEQRRDSLMKSMSNTPKFNQQMALQDDKQAAAMAALEARLNAQHQDALLKLQAKESQKQMKYNEILMQAMQTVANPQMPEQEKAVAQKIIDMHRMNKLYSNPAAWENGIDITKMGDLPIKPSVIEKAQTSQGSSPQEQITVVTNADEWKALKPGTKYKMPDGRTGIR